MPKTRLISAGSIPNHKLLKNLQLRDNYISNDGGDEGIKIDDGGVTFLTDPLKIKESANAVADTTGYGQIWVKNENPTELWFTNDADADIQLTTAGLLSPSSAVAADDITRGNAAISIGTNTGNIVFKNNSDAEWLTFNTSDIIDSSGESMSEIFSPTATKLRLRSPSGGDLQLLSGNNVDIAHRSIFASDWNGNVVKKLRTNQNFEIEAAWNADPGLDDTTGTDPAHIFHPVATYANWGLNNDTTASYSAEDGFSWNSSAEAIQGGRIFPGLSCEAEADGIDHDVNGIPTKVESVQSHTFFQINSDPTATATSVPMRHWVGQYYYPTIYDGNLEAPWQADQDFQDLMQVTDQDATTIPAQLRGSTSGVKMVIKFSTGSSGIPQVYHFPSHGGSGYTNSFTDSTCDYKHDTGLNADASSGDSNLEDRSTIIHNNDEGAIKLFMAVVGTGIPIGSYVGEVVSNTCFRIHKGGGTGAVSTADNEGRVAVSTTDTNATLSFYDRVCFQDPGSTSEHMIVQVEDAGDGTINLGTASPAQALSGHMVPRVIFDFNEARTEVLYSDRLRIVSGGVFQTDVNTVFLSGSKHTKIQGQEYTSIHAGDRFFMGALKCNNVSYFLDSRTSIKRLWLLASNVTNGDAFHATDNTVFQEAGGLEISVANETGLTNFQTRVEDGETEKQAHMSIASDGDMHLLANEGEMTLNAREGDLTIETSNTAGSDIILESIDNIVLNAADKTLVYKSIDNTTAATNEPGVHLDYDRVGAVTSGTDVNTGIDLDMNVTGAGTSGTPTVTSVGIDMDIVGDNAGSGASTATGINIAVSGADTNYALITAGGNVGLGVADPDTTLEVNGTSKVTNTGTSANALEIRATALTNGKALFIDVNDALTASATKSVANIDYDKSGVTASGQVSNTTGLIISMADAATNDAAGVVLMVGASIDVGSANSQGVIAQTGLILNVAVDSVGDAATTAGLITKVMDGGIDIKLQSSADVGDYCSISTTTNGATTIATVDDDNNEAAHLTFDIQGDTIFKGDIADGTATEVARIDSSASSLFIASGKKIEFGDAGEHIVGDGTDLDIVSSNDMTLDAAGDIILDSATGAFAMKGAGTTSEFSVANSAYAGMILGYRMIGEDTSHQAYTMTNTFAVPDAGMTVRFIAPPSGSVEVMVQVYCNTSTSGRVFYFGLSDNATYNTLGAGYEQIAYQADETDDNVVQHYWTITGLTAGDTYNYWFGAKISATTGYLNWGGTSTGRYCDFIMKVTALPTAVSDFAVYG